VYGNPPAKTRPSSGPGDSGAGDSGAGDSGVGDSGVGDSGVGDNGPGDNGAGDSEDQHGLGELRHARRCRREPSWPSGIKSSRERY
jgi:hypothetical protein